MILSLEEVKEYLKVDYDDEDDLLNELIEVAEEYLYAATGKKFDSTNKRAKLYCRVLVNEWFKDRALTENSTKNLNVTQKIRFTLQSILTQLKFEGDTNG
ncbi:head-tail connector protein [Clostridium sp. Ade.TY]|uniref:head-tail connector protein n=1 Tax=Clostridium sp. Ade.TY TaxID=1391647 RepID=UPI0003FFB2A4|nr:head-tail connector protein [Clostridium sp. Ade.TY]